MLAVDRRSVLGVGKKRRDVPSRPLGTFEGNAGGGPRNASSSLASMVSSLDAVRACRSCALRLEKRLSFCLNAK